MVRWLSTCAFGMVEVVGKALTSSDFTPQVLSSIEAVRPAPPPPTIRTGTRWEADIDSSFRVERHEAPCRDAETDDADQQGGHKALAEAPMRLDRACHQRREAERGDE